MKWQIAEVAPQASNACRFLRSPVHPFTVAIILLAALPRTAVSQTLRVDGGQGAQIVQVDRSHGTSLFALSALEPLGARIESDARGARVQLFGDTVSFLYTTPFFSAGKDVFQLIAPVQRINGRVYAPTQFLTEWLPARYPQQLSFADGTLRSKQPSAARTPVARAPAPAPRNASRVVVIDPGHGGRDPGKIGPNGLAEKNLALTVSAKLAGLLRDRGYEVHLTRSTDTLIALDDRPKLANQWKKGRPATLFMSIHANSGVPGSEGFETYFLSEARTDDERRVAEMENAAVAYEEKPPYSGPALDQLLNSLRNDYYQRASNDFAEVVQRQLGSFHPGPNRGVKQAGFRVLVGAVMPAVLVEIGFMSHSREVRLLGTSAFQQKIAFGLARAVENFFDSHEHLWAGMEEPK